MKKLLVVLAAFAPTFAFAQGTAIGNTFTNLNTTANSLGGFAKALTGTVNSVVPLLIAVAIVVFIYSVIRFVLAKGPEERSGARTLLISSIISIAVILAIFGLANFLISFFGISTGSGGFSANSVPTVPTT